MWCPGQKPRSALQVWLQRIQPAMFHNSLQWGREVPNRNLALPWLSLSCWMSSWGSREQRAAATAGQEEERWWMVQLSKL